MKITAKKKKNFIKELVEAFDMPGEILSICLYICAFAADAALSIYTGFSLSCRAYNIGWETSFALTSFREQKMPLLLWLFGILLSLFLFFVYLGIFLGLYLIAIKIRDRLLPRIYEVCSKLGAVYRSCYLPLSEDEIYVTADRAQNGMLQNGKLCITDAQAYFSYVTKQVMYKGVLGCEYLPLSIEDLRAMLTLCLKVFKDDPNGTIFALTAKEMESWWLYTAADHQSPRQFFDHYQKRRVADTPHVYNECASIMEDGCVLLSYYCAETDFRGKTDCEHHTIKI